MSTQRPGLWMLPAHVGTSRSALAALQREFARVRSLEHPHIARLRDLGRNGDQYYVTGERLDGESLRDVLTHLLPERLDVNEADDIVRAIGAALVYAHEHGVAHGDVRAENVFVTMNRRFVLTNFLARRVAKVAGRPPQPSDDVRALARLAAELYTGAASAQSVRGAHGHVPAERLNAIRAVLEAPSSRRVGSVAEFLAAAGLASARAGAATARRAREAAPRRTWSIWRLVLPMAAVIAVGMWAISYHAAEPEWPTSAVDDVLRAVAARVVTRSEPPKDTGFGEAAPQPGADAPPPPATESPAEPGAHALREPIAPERSASEPAATGPAVSAPTGTAMPVSEPSAPVSEPPASVPEPPASEPSAPPEVTAVQPRFPATISLGLAQVAAREDHTVVAIDVTRSGDLSREATVFWWTVPQTADEGDDYVGLGQHALTFAAGATVQRILVPLVNDGVAEQPEIFNVRIEKPRGAVIGPVTTTRVTLYDDD